MPIGHGLFVAANPPDFKRLNGVRDGMLPNVAKKPQSFQVVLHSIIGFYINDLV